MTTETTTATATFGERRREEFMQAWRDASAQARHEERAQPPVLERPKPIALRWPRAYTLTTLEPDSLHGSRVRTVMLGDFATCRATAESNRMDIFETTYLLAVIEEVYPNHTYGGYGGRDAYWFAWRGEHRTGGYVSIATPAMFANTSGFGIG